METLEANFIFYLKKVPQMFKNICYQLKFIVTTPESLLHAAMDYLCARLFRMKKFLIKKLKNYIFHMKIFQLVDALPESALQHKNVQKFKFHQHIFRGENSPDRESRKTVVKFSSCNEVGKSRSLAPASYS